MGRLWRQGSAPGAGPLSLPGRGPPLPAPRAGGLRPLPLPRQVLAFLKSEGACFLADLQEGTGLPGDELAAALVELVVAGLVTNDTLQTLRLMLAWGEEMGCRNENPSARWRPSCSLAQGPAARSGC